MLKKIQFSLFALVICVANINAQITTILDFETPATSTSLFYFGTVAYDGAPTTILANPDPSGINTSDSVSNFLKTADSQVWTGVYTDPNPQTSMNLMSGGSICVDVWSAQATNLAIKLEAPASGGTEEWILQQPIAQTSTWHQLCFDSSLPSDENVNQVAEGFDWSKLVLFFDFGTPGGSADVEYFFDNVVVNTTVDTTSYPVTFRVDMNEYGNTFTDLNLMGEFNGWDGVANPMNDMGNGIYETTLNLQIGNYQYKYNVDGSTEEDFPRWRECAVLTFDGADVFSNRSVQVTGITTVPMHLYGSCYSADDEVIDLTFHVNMDNQYVSPDGAHLAGGANFLPQGKFPLSDDDGDGFHSLTFQRLSGFEVGHFTFINGICYQYWDCKEDISYQDCADVNNFNDRFIGGAQSADFTYSTCFADCSTTGTCLFVEESDTGEVNILEFEEGLVKIQPTLVENILTINVNDNINALNLNIVNAIGKVVYTKSNINNNDNYDLSSLDKGIYFVKISNDLYYSTQKIIKL